MTWLEAKSAHFDHIQKKTSIQGFSSKLEIFLPVEKNQFSVKSGFGNVLPYGRRLGHARGLLGARTRAASFDSALARCLEAIVSEAF